MGHVKQHTQNAPYHTILIRRSTCDPPPGNVPVALTPMTTILTAGRRCSSAVAVGSQVWQPVCYAERLRCVAVDTADLVDAGLVLAGLYVVSNCRLVQRRVRRRTQRHLIQHLHADSTHTSCQRISTKPHLISFFYFLVCISVFHFLVVGSVR